MAMATTLGNQQTWVPYETTKDCTLGFCSIFCPQWCYVIFPPPPPIPALDDQAPTAGNSAAFSPLVIAVIGILAAAFLLVSYYTIISKYCTRLDTLRRRTAAGGEESMRHEAEWQNFSPSDGLDEAVIRKIAVYRYRPGEGVVDGTDCSVCLGEFRADESLRMLPKCSHAFHRQCIDTWLGSHSNCPLCRASIAAAPAAAPPQEEPARNDRYEMTVVIEDGDAGSDVVGEEESRREDGGDDGMTIRRGESLMGDGSCIRISIGDVLKLSMEGEISGAKDSGML